MEQKHLYLSALSVGVGVGLGYASGQRWSGASNAPIAGVNGDQIEMELLRLVQDGKDSTVTFEDFPYYLRYAYFSYNHHHHLCLFRFFTRCKVCVHLTVF